MQKDQPYGHFLPVPTHEPENLASATFNNFFRLQVKGIAGQLHGRQVEVIRHVLTKPDGECHSHFYIGPKDDQEPFERDHGHFITVDETEDSRVLVITGGARPAVGIPTIFAVERVQINELGNWLGLLFDFLCGDSW